MYLSRVELNPYRRETVKGLSSPQLMHAAVMASFASFGEPVEDRVLWRIDRLGAAMYLLVQSQRKPDFHHIVDQFGRPDAGQTWDCLDYGPFLAGIANGQTWRFRLVANPTHSESRDGKRGKVYAHVTAEQQKKWLLEKAGGNGFAVLDPEGNPTFDIMQRELLRFERSGKTVTVSIVTFEGVLQVTDAGMLRKAMESGFGRAKAYGCGMLTIAKP